MAQATTTAPTGLNVRGWRLIAVLAIVVSLTIAAIAYVAESQSSTSAGENSAAVYNQDRANAASSARLYGLAWYHQPNDRARIADAARWQAQADAIAARAGLVKGQRAYADRLQKLAESLPGS